MQLHVFMQLNQVGSQVQTHFTSTEAEDSTPAESDYETAAAEGDGLWCPWLQWPVPVIRLPDCTGLTNVWQNWLWFGDENPFCQKFLLTGSCK